MVKIGFSVVAGFLKVLAIPLVAILTFVALYIVVCLGFYVYFYLKGYRLKSGERVRVRKKSVLKRVLIEAPKRYVLDFFAREPEYFRPQGLVIFTGFQGSGKTSALVQATMELQKEYPKVKVLSNLGYTKMSEELKHWKQLTEYKNGIQGVIVQMDELQNWFSSKQSKNFPPEMLAVVTQNRKNRRLIVGTAQNFYMLAKDIRTQCTEIRKCLTLAGCITVVHRVRPICTEAGEVEKLKHLGFYFFVHSTELRESYDTYKVVEALSQAGFEPKKSVLLE